MYPISYTMKVEVVLFILGILLPGQHLSQGLIFREDQFTDMTQECLKSDGKPLRHILNADNPAMYVSVDGNHDIKKFKRAERTRLFKKITNDQFNQKHLLQDLADGRSQWLNDLKFITDLQSGSGSSSSSDSAQRKVDHHKNQELGKQHSNSHTNLKNEQLQFNRNNSTNYFNCKLQFETELPQGEKNGDKYDALSLFIIEYHPSQAASIGLIKRPKVEVITFGHQGYHRKQVNKIAEYSNKLWPGNNPNFLLSGQLTGLDTTDFKTKVDPEHLVKPESLHSTFDKPASVSIALSKWYYESHIYIVVTSYKYLRNGERCQEGKEFDCFSYNFLSASTDRMCISTNLACDGVPNCGQSFLPNQDENCFKIHWSSVLLSLVSYILLAITLLLCLSCFARVLIQWSVRSSLAELRTVGSPTGSFRGSSRFFSFLGTTFSGRWERPPPTYDEALKHINPDLARPTAPPPYSDGLTASERRPSDVSHGIIETPPPEYDYSHDILHPRAGGLTAAVGAQHQPLPGRAEAVEATLANEANVQLPPPHHTSALGTTAAAPSSRRSHHHRKHRHRTSKNKTVTTAADVLATSVSAEALLLSPTVIGGGRGEAVDSLSRGCSATTVLMVAEAASSPMSPITLTSVEINEVNPQISTAAAAPLAAMEAMSHMEATEATMASEVMSMDYSAIDMSPSRFSSNSINTVILNPGAVSLTSMTSGLQENNENNENQSNSSPYRESQIRT